MQPRPCPLSSPQAVTHPREYRNSSVVRMDTFWSHWQSRAAECPWGSGKPATETVLLHHEDFKIPERLARFAVIHGGLGPGGDAYGVGGRASVGWGLRTCM